MAIRTIEQRISAGNQFDGTAPSGDAVLGTDLEQYPEEAAGGLFDFGLDNPAEIHHIELKLGGQTSWSLSKRDKDGVDVILWAGTTETAFVTLAEDRMPILEDQKLVLVTTGATAAMKARISIG